MTINNRDDYGKLIKLLYPSIEASGNVYYGQTRKLTTDEILGKNLLNFESHIETFNKGIYGYKSYFNWRLGPLSGSVQVVPIDNNLDGRIEGYQLPTAVDPIIRDTVIRLYKDGTSTNLDVADEPALYIDGTIFVKYRLNVSSKAVEQLTNSGSFPVYENNVEPVFECFVVTDWFDPSNVDGFNVYDIRDRNFFVEYKNGECYLYIQLMSDEVQSPNVKLDLNQPMTFTALQANSQVNFRWNDASSYEINQYNGYGWVSIPDNDHTVVLQNVGDKVSIRYFDAVNNTMSNPRFYLTGSVKASGNICSLLSKLYGEANSRIDFTAYNLKFSYMFQNETALTDVSELYIYIQRASSSCCAYMFDGCTYIAYPPKLTIEYAASNCFEAMFSNCTRLKYAPELIATDLANSCYYMMFAGCTSLNNAPYLPATTMYQNCYDSMFSGCTNLKYAMAILPAKSLNTYCYNSMFSRCVNLKIAPILPATSTPRDCYSYMFSGCSELSYVCCLANNLNPDYPPTITDWLNDVAATGKLLVLNNAPQHLVDSLPTGWQLIRLTDSDVSDINNIEVRHPGIGFNCRLSDSEEPNKYFYVATSGADSVNNGRGKLNDNTTFNMLSTNPILSDTEYDTCDLNTGNANQEVWGYKCFNSPVSFRNGIYGECASLITSNPNCDSLNIRLSGNNDVVDTLEPTYNLGTKFICKTPEHEYLYSTLSQYDPCSTIELYQSSVKEDNYNNDTDGNYKACVSQASIIASNKYNNIVKFNRYIDLNAVNGNDEGDINSAAVVTSASICPLVNMSTEVTGYNEVYKTSITAGAAIAKLEHINNTSLISVTADTINILPRVTNNSFIGSNEDKFDSVYANNLFGCIPCPTCTGILAYPELEVGSIVLISLYPSSSIAINGFTSEAYKNLNIPLTFKAFDTSTVLLKDLTNNYLYSINNAPFEEYPRYNMINLSKGDTVAFKNTSDAKPTAGFDITGNVSVYGNIHSMLNNNFENILSLSSYGNGTFEFLFENCNGISDASGLALPASTLTDDCYFGLFKNCTNLKKGCMTGSSAAPRSHYSMFENCTSLTTVYRVCTVNAAYECYCKMFKDCTSLQTAPEISINSLFDSCCKQMFEGCTSLKVAPVLCTDVLAQDCYKWMFKDCINLQLIKCLATQSAYSTDQEWLQNTYSSGKIIFKDGLHAYVNASLPTPNNWSTSLVTDNKFSDVHILPGSIIRPGCIFTLDYKSVLTPTNSEVQSRLGTLEKLGEISIAAVTSENNGSISVSIDNSTIGLFSDYTFKLLSGCVCNNTPGYALAMRVE